MIRLKCPACGCDFQVKGEHAGSHERCTQCNLLVVIPVPAPNAPPPSEAAEQEDVTLPEGQMRLQDHPHDGALLRPPPAWASPQIRAATPEEPRGVRRYPWPIDVLLYPATLSGLLNLAVFGMLPLCGIGAMHVNLYVGALCLTVCVFVIGYLTCYLAECVRESADGATRAPDNMITMPGFMDGSFQIPEPLLAAIAFAVPPTAYALVRWQIDPLFWAILGSALFFFPMALLSLILFDSVSGLNPRYWVRPIGHVFLPYLCLIAAMAMLAATPALTLVAMEWSVAAFVLSAILSLYLAMIATHLLGRFYFRYEDKIGW